jgi:hypothetical protein
MVIVIIILKGIMVMLIKLKLIIVKKENFLKRRWFMKTITKALQHQNFNNSVKLTEYLKEYNKLIAWQLIIQIIPTRGKTSGTQKLSRLTSLISTLTT